MELKEALQQLELLQKKLYAYNTATSSLYLDSVTTAPKNTSEGRGVAMSILAGESQKLLTDPKVGELLDFLSEHLEELDYLVKRQVEELRRNYEQMSRIPGDEYMEYTMLTNEASDVWHKAKENSNFELFRPVLEIWWHLTRNLPDIMIVLKNLMMHCSMNMNAVLIWNIWTISSLSSKQSWFR